MKAVGYQKSLPITHADSLLDITLDKPVPGAKDLLVQIAAISVNPVDTKMRMRAASEDGNPLVLGWDGVGTVVAKGPELLAKSLSLFPMPKQPRFLLHP